MIGQSYRFQPERNVPFWRSRQIRLVLLLLLVAILPLAITGWINLNQTREILQQEAFDKLVLARHLKAAQFESFFQWVTDDVTMRSQSSVVIQAMQAFSVNQNLYDIRQLGYLDQPEIIDSGKGTPYDIAHRTYHPIFTDIVENTVYEDVYLIAPNGDILYNHRKDPDFATNLLTGDYRNTHLAHLFEILQPSLNRNQVRFTDFEFFAPTGERDIGFMGSPIVKDNKNIGVLIFKLSLTRINELLHPNLDTIGQTGEIYLVGPDYLMRSDSRLSSASTMLRQKVDNQAVRAALVGFTGESELIGYRGEPTFVAYRPLRFGQQIGTQTWALLAEISQTEALAPANQLRDFSFTILTLAILIFGPLGFWLVRQLNRPITNLTQTALAIAGGNLDLRTEDHHRDEVGLLAEAFNSMADQFKTVIDTLETRIIERTQQITSIVEVGQQFMEVFDLNELLSQVVTQIKEQFDFDHVHLYLFDSENKVLVLAEGSGETGFEMKRRGYTISLDSSRNLVARSVRERQILAINDVSQMPYWFSNPLLSNIKAELAVPIISGSEVLGVLDIQHETAGVFTDMDRLTLGLLINQVAIAIRNARLFSETQNALAQAQQIQRLYISQSWGQLSETDRTQDYEYRKPYLPPLDQVTTPEALMALQQKRTVTFTANMQRQDTGQQFTPQDFDTDSVPGEHQPAPEIMSYQVAATPLTLYGEVIGVLGIHSTDPDRVWTDDEIALIEAVSEQMSLAIENARLFEQTQRDAWRNQVISETTAQVWTSSEVKEVMQAAVSQLAEKLNASEVVIQLGPPTELPQEDDQDE